MDTHTPTQAGTRILGAAVLAFVGMVALPTPPAAANEVGGTNALRVGAYQPPTDADIDLRLHEFGDSFAGSMDATSGSSSSRVSLVTTTQREEGQALSISSRLDAQAVAASGPPGAYGSVSGSQSLFLRSGDTAERWTWELSVDVAGDASDCTFSYELPDGDSGGTCAEYADRTGEFTLEAGGGVESFQFSFDANAAEGESFDAAVLLEITRSCDNPPPPDTGGTIEGTEGADVLCGGPGTDVIVGLGGDDTLIGGAGNDVISGGDGTDTITGGIGDDTVFGGGGNDTVNGEIGDDTLDGDGGFATALTAGVDTVDGGPGKDVISGGGQGDFLVGGPDDDEVYGDAMDGQSPVGPEGDDVMEAGTGFDLLEGDGGADNLIGGDDAVGDILIGNDGVDTILGGPGEDNIFGGDDRDVVEAGAGPDNVTGGDGPDTIKGQAGEDVLRGDAGRDKLYGQDDVDVLLGGPDDDRLWGGRQEDRLVGGADRDRLDGGAGPDNMFGMEGRDRFLARDGTRDTLAGGPGKDRARVDKKDQRESIEKLF